MSEVKVVTREGLQAILDDIVIANSFTAAIPKLGWEIRDKSCENAWFVNLTYERPDTFTGAIGIGRGREEIVREGATESFVVKTAWVLLHMLVTHELMEALTYRGRRLFNPHHTVDDLALAADAWSKRNQASV